MATYIILSQLSPEAFREPKEFKKLADSVSSKIKKECPNVTWKSSYATMGRFDVVDVVEAKDPRDVERAAMIIRAHGHAVTETLMATPWEDFLKML
ncbi:MAG TPA: GYD domain-containing protein [Terriglobales bacterium]|nr:GYD domain-containing protein [Terriglobales bacterium]